MRLTDEQIMDIKEYLNRSIKITISSLIPRISKHCLDLIDTIEALQQENEQLQAQVAKMQEVLRGIEKEYVNDFTDEELDENLCPRDNAILNYWVRPVLNYGTVNYHNPADVEALEKAREALDYWRELYGIGLEVLNWHMNGNTEPFDSFYDNSGTYEALVEIDKEIGGGDVDKG